MTITLPDGREVTEIVLPDGSTATQVIAPDGSVVFDAGSAIPDSGIARYTFEGEGDTATLTDEWYDNDGSIEGMTYSTDSQEGTHSGSFDGTDDAVNLSSLNAANTGDEWAFGGWLITTATDDQKAISLQPAYEGGQTTVSIGVEGGNFNARAYGQGTAANQNLDGSAVTIGVWKHFIVQHTVADEYEFYEDGELATSAARTNPIDQPLGDSELGNRGDNSSYFNGRLDLVDFYDKELSSTEVSNLYNTGSIDG